MLKHNLLGIIGKYILREFFIL